MAVLGSVLLLWILSVVGVVSAQLNVTITLRDTYAFGPGSFSATSGESVDLRLVNAGALDHTFTLFAQADADVPVDDSMALVDYYVANAKIVDLILAGGEQLSSAFTTPLTVGTYTFVCMSPGHAASGMHGTMTVATAPPTVAILAPIDGSILGSPSVMVSGTASDDLGVDRVELSIDAMSWVLASGTTSWSGTLPLAGGPNTIFARATNTEGNTATDSVAVTVDTADPTVAIASPSNGASLNSISVVVSGTASDDGAVASVELGLDDTNYILASGMTSWTGPLTLAEGSNTIFARATDTVGNTATVSVAVTVDTVKPTAVAGGDQTVQAGAMASFDGSASSDDVAIVSYEWDFGDGTAGTGPMATHVFADPGAYRVTLTVRDPSGNTHTDVLNVTVEAAPIAPVPPEVVMVWVLGAIAAVAAGVALLLWRRRGGMKEKG
ncbi:MAG: PKD domain-containing protein [Thermoplasmata archaeon]